jgi:hypothetical protein
MRYSFTLFPDVIEEAILARRHPVITNGKITFKGLK